MFKLFLLLYADDIVIMSETEEGLKHGLFLLKNYCDRWKLTVNATKTKVMIFMKGGRVNRNIRFIYKENVLEIVSKFTYSIYSMLKTKVTDKPRVGRVCL